MFIELNFITVFWRKEGKDNRGQNEGVLYPLRGTPPRQALHGQGQLPTGAGRNEVGGMERT